MSINQLTFSDGEIDSVGFEVPYFAVYFRQWDGRRFKLKFEGVVYLELFELCSDTNDTALSTSSPKIEMIKSRILGDGGSPRDHNGFKFEQISFTSSDGLEYLTLIYSGCIVEEI